MENIGNPSEPKSPVWSTCLTRKGKEKGHVREGLTQRPSRRIWGTLLREGNMWSFQEPGSSRLLSLSLPSALAVGSLLTFGKETGSSSQVCLTAWKPAFPPH